MSTSLYVYNVEHENTKKETIALLLSRAMYEKIADQREVGMLQ